MNSFSSMDLVILQGPQSGGRVHLDCKNSLLIGADLKCDIVLRDPAITDQQVRLIVTEDKITLQVLSGDVYLTGGILASGEQTTLLAYMPVKIGNSIFAYGGPGDNQWESIPEQLPVDEASINPEKGMPERSDVNQEVIHYAKMPYVLTALILFLAIGGATLFSHPYEVTVTTEDEIQWLSEFLQQEKFIDLQLEKDADGNPVVNGYLQTKSDNKLLVNYLSGLNVFVKNHIEVGEELVAQVRDIYRLNNVEADVQLLERGIVKVITAENDTELLKTIEQISSRDIPQLSRLETENYPQDVANDDDDYIKNDPGKIVTLIVPGDPAYLLTTDQSRYFVGAMLPSGHKIYDIAQDKVFLVKAGVETMLTF